MNIQTKKNNKMMQWFKPWMRKQKKLIIFFNKTKRNQGAAGNCQNNY